MISIPWVFRVQVAALRFWPSSDLTRLICTSYASHDNGRYKPNITFPYWSDNTSGNINWRRSSTRAPTNPFAVIRDFDLATTELSLQHR